MSKRNIAQALLNSPSCIPTKKTESRHIEDHEEAPRRHLPCSAGSKPPRSGTAQDPRPHSVCGNAPPHRSHDLGGIEPRGPHPRRSPGKQDQERPQRHRLRKEKIAGTQACRRVCEPVHGNPVLPGRHLGGHRHALPRPLPHGQHAGRLRSSHRGHHRHHGDPLRHPSLHPGGSQRQCRRKAPRHDHHHGDGEQKGSPARGDSHRRSGRGRHRPSLCRRHDSRRHENHRGQGPLCKSGEPDGRERTGREDPRKLRGVRLGNLLRKHRPHGQQRCFGQRHRACL